MALKTLYSSVTNTTNVMSIRFSEAYNDSAPLVIIEALNTSLSLGDSIDVSIGYVGDYTHIFTGYVKEINTTTPETKIRISAYGAMIRAVDFFIASSDPNNPFSRENISAESLVRDLVALAGLTNFGYDATSFTFATTAPMEVNLVAAYDFCNSIANTLAWHLYADKAGKVWFVDRKPYIVPGDTPTATITVNEITQASNSISERDLRNRIVVYGGNDIYADASASSPYLPAGFYKTVVASAYWIDSQSMAQKAADYNLAALNRLTEEATITILGDASLSTRDIITVIETHTGISSDWIIYGTEHVFGKSGFLTTLTLRK